MTAEPWNGLPPDADTTGWHKVQAPAANVVQTMWNATKKVWVFGNPKSRSSHRVDAEWMVLNKFAYLGATEEPIFATRAPKTNRAATRLMPKTITGKDIVIGTIMKDGRVVSEAKPYDGKLMDIFGNARSIDFLNGGGQIIRDDDFIEIWIPA